MQTFTKETPNKHERQKSVDLMLSRSQIEDTFLEDQAVPSCLKGSLIFKELLEFENGTLNYSSSIKVFYENEELDVCSMVAANEDDLIEGDYTINVFDGAKLIATSKMTLK